MEIPSLEHGYPRSAGDANSASVVRQNSRRPGLFNGIEVFPDYGQIDGLRPDSILEIRFILETHDIGARFAN